MLRLKLHVNLSLINVSQTLVRLELKQLSWFHGNVHVQSYECKNLPARSLTFQNDI